jgi:hypothetical protein
VYKTVTLSGFRVPDNRVLRRIFGPKMEEVAGGWRRLHNEELHKFTLHQLLLGDQIKEDEMGGHVARAEEMKTGFLSENLKR